MTARFCADHGLTYPKDVGHACSFSIIMGRMIGCGLEGSKSEGVIRLHEAYGVTWASVGDGGERREISGQGSVGRGDGGRRELAPGCGAPGAVIVNAILKAVLCRRLGIASTSSLPGPTPFFLSS
jgi:hypothetical protein